jgi:predicted DNA-binding protein with PD1-like motif
VEFKRFGNKLVIRIDKGEEIVATLKELCKEEGIKLGLVSGIGAVNKATIGLFETSIKKYHSTQLTGDHEIAGLTGNISTMEGEVYLHLHACLSDASYQTFGGHLNEAVVSATSEIIIDVIEGELDRKFSDEIGLNLIKF